MRKACEPTLFFSVYLRKDCPHDSTDPRSLVLKQVDAFRDRYGLKPVSQSRYVRASDIDLAELGSSPTNFELVFQAHTQYPQLRVGTYYECLTYAYHDALIVQITITKFSDWVGTFTAGWNELFTSLCSGFDAKALNYALNGALGASAVYWAIAEDGSKPELYSDEIREIAADNNLQKTGTDLGGPLWRCDGPIFANAMDISQDLWMLVTPRSEKNEKEMNRRFWQPYASDPPDFSVVALAQHKIAYERTQHTQERPGLAKARTSLDQRASKLVRLQRNLSRELDELRSHEALEFQQQVAHANASLADYRHFVSLLKELRRTVMINRRIYLINCVALISSIGAKRVAGSIHQEQVAADLLASSQQDEIFGSYLGKLQGFCQQLDSDIDYADSLVERHAATLHSAGEQLRISGERELGEIAHHLSIDSAAVVASVIAVIAVETVLKSPLETTHGIGASAWFLTLFLVVGSFAATQVLSSGGQGKKLERGSLALSGGLLAGFLWSLISGKISGIPTFSDLYHRLLYIVALLDRDLLYIVAVLAGTGLGWFAHRRFQERRNRYKGRRPIEKDGPSEPQLS
jgi:hypothetical protein